jgi:hypothetical protein
MIVWRGLGYLALLIPVVLLGFLFLVIDLSLEENQSAGQYWKRHRWPAVTVGIVSASILAPLGWFLNQRFRKRKYGIYGRWWMPVAFDGHWLALIKLEYWSVIMLIFSLIVGVVPRR